MTRALWDDVLMLLVVMMLSDGRVVEIELDMFDRAVEVLQNRLEPDEGAMPKNAARVWYEQNIERAHELARRDDFDAALVPLLVRLQALENRQTLLDSLADIADADYYRTHSENDLIILASAFWGLISPVETSRSHILHA
jgi:uncharacterized tellurite resistance protein B-like protein